MNKRGKNQTQSEDDGPGANAALDRLRELLPESHDEATVEQLSILSKGLTASDIDDITTEFRTELATRAERRDPLPDPARFLRAILVRKRKEILGLIDRP